MGTEELSMGRVFGPLRLGKESSTGEKHFPPMAHEDLRKALVVASFLETSDTLIVRQR
jgi:hypothetical protein